MINRRQQWISVVVGAVLFSATSLAIAESSEAEAVTLDPMRVQMGTLLSPKAFRAAAERVRGSVVTIETFGGALNAGGDGRPRAPLPEAKPQPQRRPAPGGRPGQPQRPQFRPGEGATTGLVISKDGLIITSMYSFVRTPPIITVTLANGEQRVAKLLGRDETRKIALLQIDPDGLELTVPDFVDRKSLRVGQWAISVGVGYTGSEQAISSGIISATQRISGRAIQTDANINPGNYGGPLIDITGRVIGICVPLSPQGDAVVAGVEWYDSGIGFAIPINDIVSTLDRLKDPDLVIRAGKMGIRLAGMRDGGVVIGAIGTGSPAERAELKNGDILVAINDLPTPDVTELMRVIGRYRSGETVTASIKRGDDLLQIKVELSDGNWPMPAQPDKKPKPDGSDEQGEKAPEEAADSEPDSPTDESTPAESEQDGGAVDPDEEKAEPAPDLPSGASDDSAT